MHTRQQRMQKALSLRASRNFPSRIRERKPEMATLLKDVNQGWNHPLTLSAPTSLYFGRVSLCLEVHSQTVEQDECFRPRSPCFIL
eukprot:4690557-Amphidinium_carterae.1